MIQNEIGIRGLTHQGVIYKNNRKSNLDWMEWSKGMLSRGSNSCAAT